MKNSFKISDALKGGFVPADILKTEATFSLQICTSQISKGGLLFEVFNAEFSLSFRFYRNMAVLERNEILCVLSLEEYMKLDQTIHVFAMWTPIKLTLICKFSDNKTVKSEISTPPSAPPVELLRWVKKQNIIDTPSYVSEESLREKVYSCLNTINEKIREADAYKSFWNLTYSGNSITSTLPKKEIELQPLIQCLLSDQMLSDNIEVIPEHKTGEGNIDFSFIGMVDREGPRKVCAEFKLAHSRDLENGLMVQLPLYMNVSGAKYGAYCVLNYKGEWFNKPVFNHGFDLEFHLNKLRLESSKPEHLNVRNFIYNFAKPPTASRK